ncbi:uncharacterized protein LOC121368710 [Gigantopelta aegis]|uniref:uncharacterized protein LOC121368710 n=1 Tax=Gigantopelta aegis TaxID=1735272 RepID=UPI001B8888F7|nr:uncharacterized protein LOC121368710 [Gigantopelta aegis]
MLKLLLVSAFVGVCFCKPNGETIARWTRELRTDDGNVLKIEEHAELVGDRQILMNSDDRQLEDAQIYKSHSFHDFETGVLAIKYVPYGEKEGRGCFLGQVAKDFKTTAKELKSRKGKTIRSCSNGIHYQTSKQVDSSGSKYVDDFCRNVPMYAMERSSFEEIREIFPQEELKPWRIRTLCIWIDINIWFPWNMPIDDLFAPIYKIEGGRLNEKQYTCNAELQ